MESKYIKSTWRLIRNEPGEGAWNMAVDEALLESISLGNSLHVLRLYAWQPPCLSLGYAQSISEVDLERLAKYGWQIVRRPTGGRAILHTDELTYSVTAPFGEPRLEGGVLESYQRISQALMRALSYIGLPVEAHQFNAQNENDQPKGPVCFEVPSNYEITLGGKKLVGSAQARKKEGILQHGTLPLWGDLARITWALAYSDEAERRAAARKLLERATTVQDHLVQKITWEQAAQAFVAGFRDKLNLEFVERALSKQELARAADLVREKYGNPQWTKRV
jgi:lipoate-protein ligase A